MDIEETKKKAITKAILNDYMMFCCELLGIRHLRLNISFDADAPYKCKITTRDLKRITLRSSLYELQLNIPDRYAWSTAIESIFWACRRIYQRKCYVYFEDRNSTYQNSCMEKYDNILRDTYEHIEILWDFSESLEGKPYYFEDITCLDADVFADYLCFYVTSLGMPEEYTEDYIQSDWEYMQSYFRWQYFDRKAFALEVSELMNKYNIRKHNQAILRNIQIDRALRNSEYEKAVSDGSQLYS